MVTISSDMLHTEIFNDKQREMEKLVQNFAGDYYLVGGTALALQLGHRRSVDFDLFTPNSFDNKKILAKVRRHYPITQIYVSQTDQLTIMTNEVKMTWYKYDFEIPLTVSWGKITMPDELTIAAMKAFAMGQRSKWKDYVDMYFLIRKYGLKKIVEHTDKLFGEGLFDEALLRGQLAYHKDIDYREEVEFMPGFEVSKERVLAELLEASIS